MSHVRTCGAIGAALLLFASLGSFGNDLALTYTPKVYATFEWGQIAKGFDKNVGPMSNVVMEKMYAGYGLQISPYPADTFRSCAEIKVFNEFPRLVTLGATRRFYFYPYITEAQYIHGFLQSDNAAISAGIGYFPYKYDENARNLGEYLFRSTAYPQTLTTEFDYPFARLLGLYASGMFYDQLKCDVLVTTNTEYMAVHDVNLSFLGSWNLANAFEVGAGVMFGSIISADQSATTPTDANTLYVPPEDTANVSQSRSADSLAKYSHYYTFAGTKLMGRLSFDPKKLFHSALFGEQDLKIYGEAAFLGVKNYPQAYNSPIWYMSPLERIPVMLGFNFPAFKLLDVVSLEGEWWGNRYPNSQEGIVIDGLPLPFAAGTKSIDSTKYKNDNLKWSIYGCRTFAKHYQVKFQVASDHMRTFALDWNRQDWEEALRGPDNWYYEIKFGVLF
jgi:hypothetical protein